MKYTVTIGRLSGTRGGVHVSWIAANAA